MHLVCAFGLLMYRIQTSYCYCSGYSFNAVCMRIQKPGQGQSVIFCVPAEMQTTICLVDRPSESTKMSVLHVLRRAVSETHADPRRNMGNSRSEI